jgi:hypothetical protein
VPVVREVSLRHHAHHAFSAKPRHRTHTFCLSAPARWFPISDLPQSESDPLGHPLTTLPDRPHAASAGCQEVDLRMAIPGRALPLKVGWRCWHHGSTPTRLAEDSGVGGGRAVHAEVIRWAAPFISFSADGRRAAGGPELWTIAYFPRDKCT